MDSDISNNNTNNSMEHLFNLFNEITMINNDMYEQNLINNAIEQSMLETNPIKHILSEEGEKDLKTVVYTENKYSMKECPITLKEFKENEMVTMLPCNHIFDTSGIMWWLKTEQASCPVCRTLLKSKEISTYTSTSMPTSMSNILQPNGNTTTNTNMFSIETNPLSLFSNITIDISLNQHLTQPYHRDYNIPSFEVLLDSIEEENSSEDDDDLFFLNTLQRMQDPDRFMSDFQYIFTDNSNNALY